MDISVKPVSPTIASPYISAGDGVATQLPPQQTVTSIEPSLPTRYDPQKYATPVTNKVTIDKDAAAIVFQTVDDRTSEVIGQYPAESMLRRRAYIRALDNAKVEGKTTPTDRKL